MEIKIVALTEIQPYFNNPRNNSNAVPPVMESIRRFGFTKPIICDKNGVIIAGHTRYAAAACLGLTEVPVIYSDMDDEKAKLFRIADNKLAEKSEYDEDALREELAALQLPDDMQPFFFEDIKEFISPDDSRFGNFNPSNPFNEDAEDDSSAYNGSESVDSVDEPEEEQEFYKPYEEDGVRKMRIICPYCSNIETITLD